MVIQIKHLYKVFCFDFEVDIQNLSKWSLQYIFWIVKLKLKLDNIDDIDIVEMILVSDILIWESLSSFQVCNTLFTNSDGKKILGNEW